MLFFQDGLKVLLIKVNPSVLINYLVDGWNKSHPVFEMMVLINVLWKQFYDKVGVSAGKWDHKVEGILEVKMIEDKDNLYNFLCLLMVLWSNL